MNRWTAKEVIEKLKLIPLPEEGGFFRETYRSNLYVNSEKLGQKSESTAIYYLITPESFSGLHLVDMDEIFHFYMGDSVEMFQIYPDGQSQMVSLGPNLDEGEVPQYVAQTGVWQGTKLKNPRPDSWALLGCTVAPGFELENFHILSRDELTKEFPHLKKQIKEYTSF